MTIGQQLRALRVQSGFTQTDMAARIGLEQAQVSAIEVGRRDTTTAVLARWAEECGATVEISRRDSSDPIAPLLEAARGLSPDQLARLVRIARALPRLPARTADVLTAAIEGAAEDAGGRP